MPYAETFLIIVFPTSECEVSGTVMCYFQSRVVFAGSCCTCTLITGQPWHTTPCCVVCGSALRSGSHRRWSKRWGTPTLPFYSLGSLPLKTSGLHWQWRAVHDAWFQTQLEQPITYWFRDEGMEDLSAVRWRGKYIFRMSCLHSVLFLKECVCLE